MRNKSRKFLVPIAFVLLSLILTGCLKNEDMLTVNANGTVSGTGTTFLSDDLNADWLYGPDSPFTFVYDLNTPIEITNITFGNLNGCVAEDVKLWIPNEHPSVVSWAEFRIDVANTAKTVYGSGNITDQSDDGPESYYQLDEVTLIPKSGNEIDCAYFESIDSGAVAVSDDQFTNSLGNPAIGLSMLQVANIPPAERAHYVILAQTGYGVEDGYYIRYPESAACNLDRSDSRFDILNDRQLMPGEFLALLREKDLLNVKRDDAGWTLYCNYSNISLSNLSRKLPDDEVEPNVEESGLWKLASDEVSWEYFAQFLDSEDISMELNMDGNYTSDEMNAIYFALETGRESTFTINGVVLSTNGEFDENKNSVYWITAGIWYDGPVGNTIPDGVTAAEPYLNALVGNVVTFKANKSSWSSSKTLGGLKSKLTSLKKSSVDVIQIVGIKKFGLTGSAAAANLKIVKKRVTAIKNKLQAAKVKAEIEVVYLTPNSITGGDSKYANKVVVQPITAK